MDLIHKFLVKQNAMATKLKIIIVGPSKSGKTALSNYLADLSETLEQNEYHPTEGLRYFYFP
jgi:Rab-like protein 5